MLVSQVMSLESIEIFSVENVYIVSSYVVFVLQLQNLMVSLGAVIMHIRATIFSCVYCNRKSYML